MFDLETERKKKKLSYNDSVVLLYVAFSKFRYIPCIDAKNTQ